MRIAFCLVALLMLSACNVVVTKEPLFTARDEAGAPVMKPGLWRLDDGECGFDETKPISQWPECGGGAVVAPGMITGHDRKEGKEVWIRDPFVLASGNPRIAQIQMIEDAQPVEGKGPPPYGYAAVKPTKFDAQGRITEITYWLVLCGPPPPNKPMRPGKPPPLGTLHPLPGMQMKPGEAVCTTTSQKALRNAARASRAWADKVMRAHWVRDGDQ